MTELSVQRAPCPWNPVFVLWFPALANHWGLVLGLDGSCPVAVSLLVRPPLEQRGTLRAPLQCRLLPSPSLRSKVKVT